MNRHLELPEECTKFCLTLPGEQILLAKREHPVMLILRITGVTMLGIALIFLGTLVHALSIFNSPVNFLAYILISVALVANMALKVAIDWYYHIYIATNRKLLEIRSKPFFSDKVDNVFLDQVRTTEINTSIPTFIHEFLDMGNVVIEFDRPSHGEPFTLADIKDPEETAEFLGDVLENIMRPGPVWFGPTKSTDVIKFTEDIYPPQSNVAGTFDVPPRIAATH